MIHDEKKFIMTVVADLIFLYLKRYYSFGISTSSDAVSFQGAVPTFAEYFARRIFGRSGLYSRTQALHAVAGHTTHNNVVFVEARGRTHNW